MSGITATYNLDGRPNDGMLLESMSHVSAQRGPDGEGCCVTGAVGLAHRMLHNTPESLHEHQPVCDAQGRYHLVWDGRLDNRENLLKILSGHTDPELVLEAYRAWGVECVQRLIGEFAFILWDQPARQLFCARDRMGLRPLHYCVTNKTVCLSSEIKPILSVLDRMPDPDDEMVLAFLLREFRERDQTRTFFQGVHRVPPASYLSIQNGSVQIQCYWSIDPKREIRYTRDEEYAENFHALFEEVVRCRLRSINSIGCFLSGGMDSSSITCIAKRHATVPLEAIVVVGNRLESDERRFAYEIANATGIPVHEFARGADEPLTGLEEDLRLVECPVVGTNRRGGRELLQVLNARRCRTVLTGVGGDQLLDEYGYFADLLKKRPWRFIRDAKAFTNWYGGSVQELTLMSVSHLLSARMKCWAKRFLRRAPPPWINSRLARQVSLLDRIREPRVERRFPSFAQAESYLNTFSPYQVLSREVDERMVAQYGLEVRYPFYDSRLVEFVLAIPWDRRIRQGERKWVLRQAMEGIVPEPIRTRRGKGDYSSSMDEGLQTLFQRNGPSLLENSSGWLDRYLDLTEAQKLVERFSTGSYDLRWHVWSLVTLDRWLNIFWKGGETSAQLTKTAQEAVQHAPPACVR